MATTTTQPAHTHMDEPANIDIGTVLEDLAVRFILNCPFVANAGSEEVMLLMFEVEKAHWFYVDFFRPRHPALPALSINEFTSRLFDRVPFLSCFVNQVDNIVTQWKAYKCSVPTFGACILNQDLSKVLLVRGWKARSWGWPKGKINKGEEDAVCAAREVEEEIGFDILPYIDEANTIQSKIGEQKMKLYIIPYVPEGTVFETRTRQEISEIRWHSISELKGQKKEEGRSNKFYTVSPVLSKLKSWVADHERSLSRSSTPARRQDNSPPRSRNANASPRKDRAPPAPSAAVKKPRAKQAAKTRLVQTEVDAAGVARDNGVTFGDTYEQTHKAGFSAEEMFKANEEKFGIVSTYSFEQYTTALPGPAKKEDEPRGMLYADRFRPCTVNDVQRPPSVQQSCASEARKAHGFTAPIMASLAC